jgi:hypothetical protein
MRPFFSYYGGKWRAATKYPSPGNRVVVEPFAGSAGYSVRHDVKRAILIDSYAPIVGVWDYLIHARESEIRSLPMVPHGSDVREMHWPCVEARWLIGFYCSPGSVAPRNIHGTKFTNGWTEANRERVASQVQYIRQWKSVCGAYDCLDGASSESDAVWFVDPPYQQAGSIYIHGSKLIDFKALGEWTARRMQASPTIVCEASGADWYPFDRTIQVSATPVKGRAGLARERHVSNEVWATNMGEE